MDNVLVTNEIIHYMKCKTRGKQRDVALKINISKAYDGVHWGYLRAMMEKMDFASRWVDWIMLCIIFVTYFVLDNNEVVGPIFLGRGLR